MGKMVSKSIKLTREDSIALADIVARDSRVEHGPCEALGVCFADAALNPPDWVSVRARAKALDYPEELAMDGNLTKSFIVSEEHLFAVNKCILNAFPEITRPRFSFVTRLCILNTRLKLHNMSAEANSSADTADFSAVGANDLDMVAKYIALRQKKHPALKEIDMLINKCGN